MTALFATGFLVRLAAGVVLGLPLLRGTDVPSPFFRVAWLVVLGLAALATTVMVGAIGLGTAGVLCGSLAAVAYVGSVLRGLGAVSAGSTLELLACPLAVAALAALPAAGSPWPTAAEVATRLASGAVMGTMLLAMLLGHHYLTAPSMSRSPLIRLIAAAAACLVIRAALAPLIAGRSPSGMASEPVYWMALGAMRWGVGVALPAVGLKLAWESARIGSTQSATGILYVVVAFAITGELAAAYLAGGL